MSDLTIRVLDYSDAPTLAVLIAENAQAVRRGAPRRPDEVYAERVLGDKTAELIGAFDGDTLIGFAIFFDLPDLITGFRVGQLDDIYVQPEYQGKGIGKALIGFIAAAGKEREWSHVRWMVSENKDFGSDLYKRIGEPGEEKTYNVSLDRLADA
ncbi:GNAT family N-acetyltransferase [Rhodobacteraceae bacterium RKSG542]|uniref:GNAT family N-acetyltransferase n=1 Tax=Pseudovibrio flavus TaxID=2529854 RepID=UPI0012BD22A0|nr:GNAT family N-acetyltransferase [Pseudovibrio flavus]MTI18421.1 GNAT family N-acetyltransferase [Pseudovibrio flavus]